jgi:hypothetical protein
MVPNCKPAMTGTIRALALSLLFYIFFTKFHSASFKFVVFPMGQKFEIFCPYFFSPSTDLIFGPLINPLSYFELANSSSKVVLGAGGRGNKAPTATGIKTIQDLIPSSIKPPSGKCQTPPAQISRCVRTCRFPRSRGTYTKSFDSLPTS